MSQAYAEIPVLHQEKNLDQRLSCLRWEEVVFAWSTVFPTATANSSHDPQDKHWHRMILAGTHDRCYRAMSTVLSL